MPRFSANLSFLYQDRPFLERFAAAARSGFRGVEFHFPYEWPAAEVARAAREAGVEVVLFNFPAGDWAGGERGLACLPDRVAEFRAGVELALDYARELGCRQINCLAGITPDGAAADETGATLADNLCHAADRAAPYGVRVLVEPLNTVDTPGFFLCRTGQAARLLEAAGRANLHIQYDIYHAQVMEGDLARTLARFLPRIGHIQFADNPGRGEPGSGEINFPWLFAEIDRLGYGGWVGAEYRPLGTDTESGLGWLAVAENGGIAPMAAGQGAA
ncbi:hydroxypyruvate isomerase [Pseudothauera rhizosphaerae]|uniref:Hydroxypyruvate isomerase n=1 Tax=Pseudothauera rhizosphaerae TaxID=2565932 RepID=A0A4S4ALS3_9RHOO|nr:hydroxypyruvate isomerase [Pseudothauera rhizosphaerae]THF60487.1 hydroxypyruvate isomerase [Pseudothauera rhizosphaerae]